jgi:hypothetical protein
MLKSGGDAQGVAFDADPLLPFGRRRGLTLLDDVALAAEALHLDGDREEEGTQEFAVFGDVGPQAGEALARAGEFDGDGGVEGGEVSGAVRLRHGPPATGALPIEKADADRSGFDQDVFGVEVGVRKAGGVDASEFTADGAGQATAAYGVGFGSKISTKVDGAGHRLDEQERSPTAVFAGGQPLRSGETFALQGLEEVGLAERAGDEAAAVQGRRQADGRSDAVFELEIDRRVVGSVAECHAGDAAVGVAADDVAGQVQEVFGFDEAAAAEFGAAARRVFDETPAPSAAAEPQRRREEQHPGQRH